MEEVAEIVIVTTKPEVPKYTEEMVGLQLQLRSVLGNQKSGSGFADLGADFDSKQPTSFDKKMSNFKMVWNGDISNDKCQHLCVRQGDPKTWCCQDDEESRVKLSSALVEAALASVPDS